jgi:hypothetical protein
MFCIHLKRLHIFEVHCSELYSRSSSERISSRSLVYYFWITGGLYESLQIQVRSFSHLWLQCSYEVAIHGRGRSDVPIRQTIRLYTYVMWVPNGERQVILKIFCGNGGILHATGILPSFASVNLYSRITSYNRPKFRGLQFFKTRGKPG